MATTSPDNIYYPIGSTDVGDLKGVFALVATSTQAALVSLRSELAPGIKTFKPANTAALNALTGMTIGDLALQLDTGVTYRYSGTAWKAWESDLISTFTPAFTGLSLGIGGVVWYRWKYTSGKVEIFFKFTFGTGGSWANPGMTMPVPAIGASMGVFSKLGAGVAAYASAFYELSMIWFDATTIRMYALISSGSPLSYSLLNGASPFTPVSGNFINGRIEYIPA